MSSAAASLFSRAPAPVPPPAPISPTVRQQRRLSRISPSTFDSILDSGKTVKMTGAVDPSTDPDSSDLEPPPQSLPPSPRFRSEGTIARSTLQLPPGLSPEPSEAVGSNSRPIRRTKSGLESIVDGPSSSQRGSEGSNSRNVGLVVSAPSSTGNSREEDHLRPLSSSTTSIGSFVYVPFPSAPVEHRLQPTSSRGASISASSMTAFGYDISPMRKRAQSGEGMDAKISLAGTMRKMSRFFRKLGGSSTVATKATDAPYDTGADIPCVPLSPPVPAVPTVYTPPSSIAPASIRSHSRQSPAPRSPRVTRRDLPQLPPSTDMSLSEYRMSAPFLALDNSEQSIRSAASHSTTSRGGSRRRSLSLSSLQPDQHEPDSAMQRASPQGRGSNTSRAGWTSPRTEDDQLRRELKRWRLGRDGVLGSAVAGSLTPSSSIEGTPAIASQSSPHLPRAVPEQEGTGPVSFFGATPDDMPRASVATATKDFPGLRTQRSASLPGPSLAQPGSNEASAIGSPDSPETPDIRLVPSSRDGSISSSVTVDANVRRASTVRGSLSSTTSSTEAGYRVVGLGLRTNTEAGSDPSVTPYESFVPAPKDAFDGVAAKPLPPAPLEQSPTLPSATQFGTSSGQSNGARGSIVGLPSLATSARPVHPSGPSSSAVSSTSLGSSAAVSLGASTSANAPVKGKRARGAAPDDSLSEAALLEKAEGLAQLAWDEDEGFLERRKIAEWLGSAGRVNTAALRLYMDRFAFTGLSLDVAFRRLCGKLYLKAETQQVDRILEQFSRRYYEDNPKTVFASSDVVHAVAYSLLLLNTDLHVVDSTTRMSRAQFVRNTLEAIRAQTADTELLVDGASYDVPAPLQSDSRPSSRKSLDGAVTAGLEELASGVSPNRGVLESPDVASTASPINLRTGPDSRPGSQARGQVPVTNGSQLEDAHLQAALKEIYNAIKAQPIYQISSGSGSSSALNLPQDTPASSSRSSFSLTSANSTFATWTGGSNMNRAASRRSTASGTSGTVSSAYKRASIRGMGALLGTASSLDLIRSTSPTPSTATSLSSDRWNTAYGPTSQHHNVPTIGFANSLSHTIIREQHESEADTRSETSETEVTDEELALLGAPWAKEGMLSRKHYWESAGRRAKAKGWVQAFVVVSQGEVQMFRFDGTSGRSSRSMASMGGGDWTANASAIGSISLIHALCSAMPPPGYSRERPHCFVLTLPDGGSYFFQAGTPDLVAEWVATCNYWSARLSKEPLSGGVSNMEYGWNRVEAARSDGDADDREDIASIRSIRSGHSRASVYSSVLGSGADRAHINEWKPPQVPSAPSTLGEEQQLDALGKHAAIVQRELMQHDSIRTPMLRLYPPRSAAGAKALANWERKAQHLRTEMLKYRTYVEALSSAVELRALQRGRKQVERMLEIADAAEADEGPDAKASDMLSNLSLR